ncbi:murein biosynthesis integral membrane protein MurJ [Bradyrhizobium sp. WBOS7]|uniref:Probable lipid II flippase MurJ n=1 Tax=Bradyrhizobium betae TaxID=244734 RepID=A0AAE9SR56_9BRAD|nr:MULTISPECIES: murein biosynthesis integral membrane protein MurJ [Bradyrhizobium]MDD1572451.1 murein biosynthesis integral membrane protein MurJ [Bradyrhizobium sp. WBOS1]UUO34156.1 murein biosynthesis integral membrane protein MurJ [Bradyrhizobium sp. WBOS01]MDD1528318.1 murein biosynthesis integral membrane protein MurJ [Bradyrhizobium sp. WBOS2]MDD1577361.1 murein biosynthesis integral membrane protein MurJ [Bradyrhizobium sp. WBOS7]MDD1600408.1 murein biosynthesis integral membrane prot
MIRSFLTVSTGTMASRLLGFARDSMIAALLGTGAVADAFLAAFQLVNVVRRLLSEGALNAALIPAWLRVRERDGEKAAAAFAGRMLGTVSAALVAISIVIALVMPLIITMIAPGFLGSATLDLAVANARLMLPYLAFAGPVTVLMGLLNAQGRFALTAFSPLLFNIALIAAIAMLFIGHADAGVAAWLLAATVGIAGLLQLAMLLSQRSARLATPLRISFDKEMRDFFAKAVPGMIASSGPQWLMVAGAIIASATPSAVSWLYFANRLIELPLGIVGVAMGTVLVPELTRAVASSDRDAVVHAESRALELAAGLALPATLGLIVLAEPIVRLLFEHGAFSTEDSMATARALIWLALGLPAHVLIKALSPAFYARSDTMTPLLATAKGFAVAVVLAVLLGHFFGASGIAASIAAGAWSSALSLLRKGAAEFGFSVDAAARSRLPRIVLAAAAMGALLWLTTGLVHSEAHGLVRFVVLGLQIGAGIAVYGLLLQILGAASWREAFNALKRPA